MEDMNGIKITNRDRVLRVWTRSAELIRDFKAYSHEIRDDRRLAELFARYAEDEAMHASKLLEILHELEK